MSYELGAWIEGPVDSAEALRSFVPEQNHRPIPKQVSEYQLRAPSS